VQADKHIRATFFSHAHTDLVGFTASMACALHCSLLPFILTVSTLGGLKWLANPWIEVLFITLSVVIATIALGRNFRKHKHIMRAIQVVAVGFALLIASRFFEGNPEHVLSALGGIVIATGHILNWRLARTSPCCRTEHHL
jgi:uncharacterized membrane protein